MCLRNADQKATVEADVAAWASRYATATANWGMLPTTIPQSFASAIPHTQPCTYETFQARLRLHAECKLQCVHCTDHFMVHLLADLCCVQRRHACGSGKLMEHLNVHATAGDELVLG